jgi:TolA-binding protein
MSALFRMRLVLPALLPLWCLPAHAQIDSREGIALQNQILQLRSEVQALRDQIANGGGGPTYLNRPSYQAPAGGAGDITAQLLARVDALEEEVRQLRGRMDVTDNRVQQQGADLGKRIDDLAFQLQNPQAGGAPGGMPPPPQPGMPPASTSPPPGNLALAPPPPPGAPPPQAPPEAPVRRTPELAMQEANAALARHDYQTAEQSAREVLGNFRTSPRAYDAQFLLAQALMGQRQYSQAAIAYDDAYNRAHKGAHAQDALVGLADALTAINEKRAACETITKLHTEFPAPRPDIRQAATATAQRASCRS